MSCSNREIVLDSLVKSTFALLLDDANTGENREHLDLAQKLEERIELLRARRNGINNELLTSLKHLKSAVVSLRICFEDLEEWAGSSAENSTSQIVKTNFHMMKARGWKLMTILAQKPSIRIFQMTRKVDSCTRRNTHNCRKKSYKSSQPMHS
jgi:hypothetical protein